MPLPKGRKKNLPGHKGRVRMVQNILLFSDLCGILVIVRAAYFAEVSRRLSLTGFLPCLNPLQGNCPPVSAAPVCNARTPRPRRRRKAALSANRRTPPHQSCQMCPHRSAPHGEADAHHYIEKQAMDRCRFSRRAMAEKNLSLLIAEFGIYAAFAHDIDRHSV